VTTAPASAPVRPLQRLRAVDTADLPLAATAVVLPLSAHTHLPLLLIGLVLLVAMATDLRRLRSPAVWLATAGALAVADAFLFLDLDDHIVLTHYWVLGIGLSLLTTDPARSLERNGRLLVGLTMAFAVVSKLLWGEFADGGLFEATVLLDDRFNWVADIAGVADPSANYAAFDVLAAGGGPVELTTGPRIGPVVAALTAGTLLVEGAVGAAFLLPWPWLGRVRTWLLAVFCVVTYAIVPVAGFGALLLVMASADRAHDRAARVRHLAGAAGLYLWGAVWTALQ
jgi:hypothetical protein